MDSDYGRGRGLSSISDTSPKRFWRSGLGGHVQGVAVKAQSRQEKAHRFASVGLWSADQNTGAKPHIRAYEAAAEMVYGESPVNRGRR